MEQNKENIQVQSRAISLPVISPPGSGKPSKRPRLTPAATPIVLPAIKTNFHAEHSVSKGNSPCLLTEYAQKYKSHPIEPTHSFKPAEQPYQNTGPLEDKTTNRVDYIPHPYSKPPVRESEAYVKPQGDFDHHTNYHRDYTKKPIAPNRIVKKEFKRSSPGKFDGVPTYVTDFRKWSIPQRIRHGGDNTYRPSSATFEGVSNYTTDYRGAKGAARQSMKPTEAAKQSDLPFDDCTGYRQEYIKHPIHPREKREPAKYEANKAPLDGLSHYKKDYPAKPFQVTASFKPDQGAYQSDAPFHDATTQRTDYQKWPTNRPYVREPEQWVKPEGTMAMNTTSHLAYDKKPIERVAVMKPQDRKAEPGKFAGVTNYSTDFRKWTPTERVQPKSQSGGYMPPQAPFEGFSNYRDDYRKHSAPPRQSMKPNEAAKMSDAPFDGNTGYREEFIKHPLEARQKKERPQWQPNHAKLDDLSHYKKDYTEKTGGRLESFKPEGGAYRSDAPFNGDTTQKVDYQQWPTERPTLREPEAYTVPEGNFDFSTTHKTNFTKKPLERTCTQRPPSRKREPGKFEGTTNYSTDFRKWGMTDRAQQKPRAEFVPNQAPFEGKSSYTSEYIKKNAQVRSSMKPSEKGMSSDAPFDGHTMYRSDYTKKAVPPCPAAIIETGKSGFVFTGEQDLAGHKFYAPVTVTRISSAPMKTSPGPTALAVA